MATNTIRTENEVFMKRAKCDTIVSRVLNFRGRLMDHNEKVQELQQKIKELRDEIKDHARKVDDPKCAALCETSAEVMTGLETAFEHFLNKTEIWN